MAMSKTRPQALPPLQRLLVVGSGGRENSLAWALQHCIGVEAVWVTPGNGGTEEHHGCRCLAIAETDTKGLIDACQAHEINLVVVGPEAPLAAGVADELRDAGLAVFGPGAQGAQLEASKAWSKTLMEEAGVPTAKHWTVHTEAEALSVLNQVRQPLVVKADGLAAGKGVTVADSIDATADAIHDAFSGRFGTAGCQLVLEERLEGPEVSVFALCDGERFLLLPPAQDHKRLKDGDKGPNTGGMGAYAPAPLLDAAGLEVVHQLVLKPTLAALKQRGIDYRGVIYAGLMLTTSGPQVIEFNCRFGDPECQTLMPLMGPELAQVLQACALGCLDQAPELFIVDRCSACVVAAASGYPEAPRKGDRIDIQLQPDASLQLFHAGTQRSKEGHQLTSGGRVLAVVAQANDFDQAFNAAYQGLDQVHFEGITYRRDIGYQVRQS
ncbi:MAG: phosphoribosylamine--glycine ligase [Prochlorococcus sp.]|nr:phosphoribosylamine--glycine ligase [Prochlorococcaceae cyanobacterium ETNP2_MAG_10]MDP6202918.1 phosphoribosylamine--glycine ligase [Prochlorococcaceae cyanobacterium ETNP18_MAG_14]MDP6309970.1 phosphoribosylamine--glycine ligase [Prochlorococcaceae cyanobacterium ETNP14_MAG_4]HJM80108.1 phosphoribosylamine--glycine ligase [Prochlorococcaceae cyanobacterium Fu_MAG_72]|tara:strand:+ start:1769 stop:3085 length:1317 start_codon:yes stop_codon:yes gene_type:complete